MKNKIRRHRGEFVLCYDGISSNKKAKCCQLKFVSPETVSESEHGAERSCGRCSVVVFGVLHR